MRNRFFLTILAVLTVVSAGTIWIHSEFLKRERLALIDEQIRATAIALVDSQLGDLRKIDFDHAEEIISEELGENRIGKFFIIRNNQGDVVFESTGAKVLPLIEVPRQPMWVQMKTPGGFIRVLNLQLHRIHDRTLQVGVFVDKKIFSPSYLSGSSLVFLLVVLILGFAASLFLTSFLLKPVARLEAFLTNLIERLKVSPLLANTPKTLSPKASPSSKDEFERLVAGLDTLIDKVNRNYRLSRAWAYQMAHELKTPLAILQLEAERLRRENSLDEGQIRPLLLESEKISETIHSFLSWAELENAGHPRRIFANKLSSVIQSFRERMGTEGGGGSRVVVDVKSDPVVFADRSHLEQLVSNLISNALLHASGENSVFVKIDDHSLTVADSGPGIPHEVIERIGEPFNRGDSKARGHGLGLAWVSSICRFYSWRMHISSDERGTAITVSFPDEADFAKTKKEVEETAIR